jgi:hypothetical protein
LSFEISSIAANSGKVSFDIFNSKKNSFSFFVEFFRFYNIQKHIENEKPFFLVLKMSNETLPELVAIDDISNDKV